MRTCAKSCDMHAVLIFGFALFFLGIPALLTSMSFSLVGLRRLPWIPFKVAVFIFVTVWFWQSWQVPKAPPVAMTAQQQVR